MRLSTSGDGTPGLAPKYELYTGRCNPILLNYIYHQSLATHSRSSKSHNCSPVWGLGKVLAAEMARLRLRGSSLRMAPLPRSRHRGGVSSPHPPKVHALPRAQGAFPPQIENSLMWRDPVGKDVVARESLQPHPPPSCSERKETVRQQPDLTQVPLGGAKEERREGGLRPRPGKKDGKCSTDLTAWTSLLEFAQKLPAPLLTNTIQCFGMYSLQSC